MSDGPFDRRIRWQQVWEADLTAADHEDLRRLLVLIFPGYAGRGGYRDRSWAAGRPDVRLVARDGDEVVAHIAVAPRLVLAGGLPVLVGDSGMVDVRPSHRGAGLGLELLARHAALVAALYLPFGFLTCTDPTAPYYVRGGWHQLPRSVQVTQLVLDGLTAEMPGDAAMLRAASAPYDDWPVGDVVRNGYEI